MHSQGQKREQKRTTKNFAGLHNHSPLFAMPVIMNFTIFNLFFIAHSDLSENEISELPGFIFFGLKRIKTL